MAQQHIGLADEKISGDPKSAVIRDSHKDLLLPIVLSAHAWLILSLLSFTQHWCNFINLSSIFNIFSPLAWKWLPLPTLCVYIDCHHIIAHSVKTSICRKSPSPQAPFIEVWSLLSRQKVMIAYTRAILSDEGEIRSSFGINGKIFKL